MAPDVKLEVDHVIAVALGGSDDPSNLITSCEDCNQGKSSVAIDGPLVEDIARDAIRWAKAIEKAAQYREMEQEITDELIDNWDSVWCYWVTGNPKTSIPRDADWRESLKTFLNQGLTPDILNDLVSVAMNSQAKPDRTWKFFCGCCWRTITNLQETARQLIEDGEA